MSALRLQHRLTWNFIKYCLRYLNTIGRGTWSVHDRRQETGDLIDEYEKSILSNGAVQTLIASLFCIILGLFVGYIVLLTINPSGAGRTITSILKTSCIFRVRKLRWNILEVRWQNQHRADVYPFCIVCL